MKAPAIPEGSFDVEGRWAVEALLDSPWVEPVEVFLEAGRHPALVERCAGRGVPCREVSRESLAAQAGYPFHRGVRAAARRPPPREPDEAFLERSRRILVPVDLADAGNLGTLVRSAAAFSVDGILLAAGRGVDPWSRKCIRASGTAIFRLPVFEVVSLGSSLGRLAEAGFILFGASPGGASRPVGEVRPARRSALLLGSEAAGLPAEMEARCAELVRLPMDGGIDSLNVAVSGSILLWEWFGREP